MTIASGEITSQGEHGLTSHPAKVKAEESAHSIADVIPFLMYVIFLEIQHLNTTKRK